MAGPFTSKQVVNIAGSIITDTDMLAEGVTNKYFTEARVRAALLTGLSLASSADVVATDSILAAIGKLQAQLDLVGGSFANSMIRVATSNGWGSTNTRIRRFTTVVSTMGSDITYADSATLGGSFTINTTGVYAISYSDNFSVASVIGVSLNTTQPTVNVYSIPTAERLCMAIITASDLPDNCGATVVLNSGDVIRAHSSGAAGLTPASFIITRVK